MRSLTLAACVAALSIGIVYADVIATSARYSFPNHERRTVTLASTGTPANEPVVYRVVRAAYSIPGSPNSKLGGGFLDAPAGWYAKDVLPSNYAKVSNALFAQPGGKYGAHALEKVDIYPMYGDRAGSWVVQAGEDNFIKLEYPAVREASAIVIYETFNPGGVSKLKVHSANGETLTVYIEGQSNASRETLPNGASILTVALDGIHFDVRFVTIHVDASKEWRGIDAVAVRGLQSEPVTIPGDIFGNQVAIEPLPEKPYGCDAFDFQAHDGKGGPWSNRAVVTVCYGCPKNPKTNVVCSGVGACNMAECICEAGFKGDACEESMCPRHMGKVCGGKGKCESGVCRCNAEWTGEACERQRVLRQCSTCNDPHYNSFDKAVFSYYEAGETLAYQWRKNPGLPLIVAQHNYQCSTVAYRETWSPIGCVDGASIRYGDDIVTWKATSTPKLQAGSYINCQKTAPAPGVWVNVGANGLRVHFSGSGMQVSIGDTFWMEVGNGCWNIVAAIPDQEPYSNEVVGMCGNNDGIKSNDLWGALDWVDVPRFPTDAMSPISPNNFNKIKRERAIAWGKFFEPSPGCDLLTCKRCGSYLNYNQFPIRFNGNANLATYEKIAQRQVELAEATRVKAANPELHKLMTTLVRSRVNIEDIRTGRVGEDGDVIPANVDVKKLPDHLIGCPYDVLYAAMTMKTCMQWIGSHTFDDCMWDACALASKDGGLTPAEAVLKATEINVGKEKAKLAAKESEEAMKANLEKAEKRDEANAE